MSQQADCSAILFSVQITGNVVTAITERRNFTGSDPEMDLSGHHLFLPINCLEHNGGHFLPVYMISTEISLSENYQ